MRNLNIQLPVKGNYARIVLLSCIHIGHLQHDKKAFAKWMKEEVTQPDTWVIMLGDTIDNGTRSSPGASVYEQDGNPKEQTLRAFNVLRPIMEDGRTLVWFESNHSLRTFKDSGFFTAEEWLADKFGVPWGGYQAMLRLTVNKGRKKTTYTVHATHGDGGGTSLAGALSALAKQGMIAEADIYARGHHHRQCLAVQNKFSASRRNGSATVKPIMYASSGCFINYAGSYAEAKGYIPNSIGATVLNLYAKERKVTGYISV